MGDIQMQKLSTQQLVERFKIYWIGLKNRMENEEPITVDLGFGNGIDGTVKFDIDEVIDYGDFDDEKRCYRFEVGFNFTSMQDYDAMNMFSMTLDAHERRIELALDGYLNGGDMDNMDNVPLIVSYSEQDGKQIIFRPGKSDAPKMYEEEILLAESLFNAVTTHLGLIPETPFDFTPIRRYVRRHEEIHHQIASLREELTYARDEISATWDHHLSDSDD